MRNYDWNAPSWIASNEQKFDDYFKYLLQFVGRDGYFKLLTKLHSVPFVVVVQEDEDRVSDALLLRNEYMDEGGYDIKNIIGPVSVLEILIYISRRMYDLSYYPSECSDYSNHVSIQGEIFWELIYNLGIGGFDDSHWPNGGNEFVSSVIHNFVNRDINPCGRGGIFPLKHYSYDQRHVPIWYQLNEYIMEV